MEDKPEDERPAARPIRPTPEQERRQQISKDFEEISEKEDARIRKNTKILWVVAPFATIGFFVAAFTFGWFEPLATAGKGEARLSCERAVEAQLISPSSANVRTLTSAQGTNNPENWRFTGEVTAENAFGARLTSSWVCTYEDGTPSAFIN